MIVETVGAEGMQVMFVTTRVMSMALRRTWKRKTSGYMSMSHYRVLYENAPALSETVGR